jgi:peptidoglycan/LPS O-acetylase OafA/YrhL
MNFPGGDKLKQFDGAAQPSVGFGASPSKQGAPAVRGEKYRPEIDGLRALSVLAVVVYHFFPSALKGGMVGVDVFFVISGYLICGRINRLPGVDLGFLRDFYARRIRRIFPALLTVGASAFAFGYIALYADEFKELGKHLMAAAGFVSNFLSLRETGYFDAAAEQKPLLHLWSLAVEEQFYLLLPLVMMVPWLFRRRRQATLALAIISFLACLYLSYRSADSAYYLPFTRFWEILAGALIAFSEPQGEDSSAHKVRFGAMWGLGLLLGAAVLARGNVHYPGWQALAPVLGACLIIREGGAGLCGKMLASRGLVWIGLISYPLYLWHWPIVSYLKITELQPTPMQRCFGILISVVLAACTYVFIEKPVRHRKGVTTVILVLLMVGLGIAGGNIYRRGGLDYRKVNYQVYKQRFTNGLQRISGVRSAAPPQVDNPAEEDRGGFDASFPGYGEKLGDVCAKMRTDPAFFSRMKGAFQIANNDRPAGAAEDPAPERPLAHIVIIGDSHAGNLHLALKLTHPDYRFTCYSDSGCTPILARYRDKNSRGSQLLLRAREFLKQERVDLVILAARWPESFAPMAQDLEDYKSLVPRVAIAGTSPIFKNNVSDILIRHDGRREVVEYVNGFLDKTKFQLNADMRAFAAAQKVAFIDRLSPLCPFGICRLTSAGDDLFIFDAGHLTQAGARELGGHLRRGNVLGAILKQD